MSYVLECRGVQKRFGDFLASRGIDLKVSSGEIVGIIGANGAGKTTLLNMISGYLTPSAGTIVFNGQDITGLPSRLVARRGIARSFQVPQLFPRSTVLENMMLALSLLVEPPASILKIFCGGPLAADARRVLAAYGLDRYADVVVSKVPQGFRKLLDIAMATCASPTLVLLDEPTSGVSSDEKHDLMALLSQQFRQASTTVVFIEHDMDIVRDYATRVVALYDGEVIADGQADAVFSHDRVVQLITGKAKPPSAGTSHAVA